MARDEWESSEELWQFFETITDAEELHLYADGFNWDTGVEELRRVIRHPLCDRGTAFLIYWRGAPGFMARYADRSETRSPEQANHYDLLREIEQKMMDGQFKTHHFRYDLKNDRGIDLTQRYSQIPRKQAIPREMYP